jgi:hypothetical protein
VSIKKKFATAVATASLLAGIFGSAFVPAAMAAREGATATTPIARYTEISDLGDDIYDNSGGYDADGDAVDASKWGFYSDDSDDAAASDNAEIGVTLYYAGASGAGTVGSEVPEIDMVVESSTSKIKVAIIDGEVDCSDMDSVDTGVDDDDLDYYAQTDSVSDLADGDDGEYYFCVAADKSTTAAVGTITVKARASDSTGAYVTVAVMPFQALGELSSLEASITDGYKYIVNDNDPIADWITVVGKDAAGNVLNGGNGTITQYEDLGNLDNWEDNPEGWDEEQIDFLDEATFDYADSDFEDAPMEATLYSVNGDVCVSNDDTESTGSEGKSYTVKIESSDGDVVSNGITFTCTDGDARVTKLTPEATSGDMLYDEGGLPEDDELSVTATVVDSANRPFGDGSTVTCDDFTWAAFVGDEDLGDDGYEIGGIAGGECEVIDLEPDTDRMGRFTYVIKATYPNLGDATAAASTDVSFTLTYLAGGDEDVTITRTRNAAKTVATFTVDAGEDNAFESVYFQVEKANGAVVEMRRRANIDGVARLVLNRRNTVVYVYAIVGATETDTLRARFR